MSHHEKKLTFIRKLAEFLAGNPAAKSIALEIEQQLRESDPRPRWAAEWAAVRSASPVFGYATIDEAERKLTEFLC